MPFTKKAEAHCVHQSDAKLACDPTWTVPIRSSEVGMVELCAKILQIMRNDFKDYARTFCQLCARYAHLFRLCITHNWHSTIKITF